LSDPEKCAYCGNPLEDESEGGVCRACRTKRGLETLGSETVVGDGAGGTRLDGDMDVMGEAPGRYTLLGEHARGGMGRVLLVHG
jgi:hypothetical protein